MRLMPDKFCEPPLADPYEEWCGAWGAKTPGYQIGLRTSYPCGVLPWAHQEMHQESPEACSDGTQSASWTKRECL